MKESNYIVIQSWMISKLQLKNNELILFALIYGFSQDGESEYKGSYRYISEVLKISTRTVRRVIKSLENKDLIIKIDDYRGSRYKYNQEAIDDLSGVDKSTTLGVDKSTTLGVDKSTTTVYINTNSSSKEKYAKIFGNDMLIEAVALKNKLKIDTVQAQIQNFIDHASGIKVVHNNQTELFSHFGNWIRKQKLQDRDVDSEFFWFIKMFNEISRRDFVGTDDVKKLFIIQFQNGFTGKQMANAVRNLYSTSSKNKWHKANNYDFATPEHLLKNENLNKYLNIKY